MAHIKARELRPGDRLPSIRQLAQDWGVGRNAIRDGLVEAKLLGLVDLHPRAGAFVRQFDYRVLADLLAQVVELTVSQRQPRLLYLHEARAVLENETFRRSVTRRSLEDLDELRQHIHVMETADTRRMFVLADEAFHLAVARVAGNPVIVALLEAIFAMLRPDRVRLDQTEQDRTSVIQDHRDAYQVLLEQDMERAAVAGTQHVNVRIRQLLSADTAPRHEAAKVGG